MPYVLAEWNITSDKVDNKLHMIESTKENYDHRSKTLHKLYTGGKCFVSEG
jgi:hypothetical protein